MRHNDAHIKPLVGTAINNFQKHDSLCLLNKNKVDALVLIGMKI